MTKLRPDPDTRAALTAAEWRTLLAQRQVLTEGEHLRGLARYYLRRRPGSYSTAPWWLP